MQTHDHELRVAPIAGDEAAIEIAGAVDNFRPDRLGKRDLLGGGPARPLRRIVHPKRGIIAGRADEGDQCDVAAIAIDVEGAPNLIASRTMLLDRTNAKQLARPALLLFGAAIDALIISAICRACGGLKLPGAKQEPKRWPRHQRDTLHHRCLTI